MLVNAMVIGIGSAGSTMVDQIALEGIENLKKLTVTELRDSYDDLENVLRGTDIVFICTHIEDSTAMLAAPVIAKLAKSSQALTISIVRRPQQEENDQIPKASEDGFTVVRYESDAVFTFTEDTMFLTPDTLLSNRKNEPITTYLIRAVVGVLATGKDDCYVNFSDLKLVLQGAISIGYGEAEGENACFDAIHCAIESPHLSKQSIYAASSILVHFKTHPDYPIPWLNDALMIISDLTHDDMNLFFFAITTDATLNKHALNITVMNCTV